MRDMEIDDPLLRQLASPKVDNQSGSVITIENTKGLIAVACILAASAVVAMGVAFHALGRAENAVDQARLMERESRIMQEDLKYIRAFLSARGIQVPANHEEAEEPIK